MDREQFLKNKIKSLKSDNNFNNYQASIIAETLYAQQGTQKTSVDNLLNLQVGDSLGGNLQSTVKPIVKIQPGVYNEKLGNGYYLYSRYPIQNVEEDREFVTDAGLELAKKTQPYINYQKSYNSQKRIYPTATILQQGGDYEYLQQGKQMKNISRNELLNKFELDSTITSDTKPIVQVQSGVYNPKLGNGYYLYSKALSDPSFNYESDREFVTSDAFRNIVTKTPSYKTYSNNKNYNQSGGFVQGFGMDYNEQDYYNQQNINPSSYIQGDNNLDGVVNEKDSKDKFGNNTIEMSDAVNTDDTQQYNTRYNIMNPYGGADLESSLAYTGQQFGQGNVGMGVAGAGLSLLKGARNFLGGYASGKESNRVQNEYTDKRFNQNPNFTMGQQGGKITNSEYLTGEFIADEGQGNTNLENNEFVKRAETGEVKKVVGEPHLKNNKIAEGVNANLEEGDKVLSNYTKIPAKNVKELKERYSISLKKNATFADAQKAFDRKLGVTKVTEELADSIEKLGKNERVKDETAKRLNELAISEEISENKERLEMLKNPQSRIFEDLFAIQETIPKLGGGKSLYDDKGKEVVEYNKDVAQQGKQKTTVNNLLDLQVGDSIYNNSQSTVKPIVKIQSGVRNDKLGNGYYLYSKYPVQNIDEDREFVTNAGMNNVKGTQPYINYQKSYDNNKSIYPTATMLQEGGMLDLATKYGISEERAMELVGMQQGGMIKRADGSYSKPGLWDNIRKNRGSGKKPTKEMLEQEAKIKRSRQEGGEQDQMQEVFQGIAQMLQQGADPQEVAQQLANMGIPQEQIEPLIMQVMEQLQGQSQMSAEQGQQEEQMSQEEEEMMMQQGGGIPDSYIKKGFTKVGVKRDSNRPGKKWMVLARKGDDYKIVHGGASGMKDYSQHGSEDRKKRFWDRMGGRDSAKAKDPFSPLFWHARFKTWQQGGEYQDVSKTSDMIEEALNEGATLREVYEELVNKGLSEEMASDLLSEYEDDGEQEEEISMAQQGIFYAQEAPRRVASKYENSELYKKQNPTSGEWSSFGELLKENPQEVLFDIKDKHPELYEKYFKGNKIPSHGKIGEFQDAVNKKYEDIKTDYVKTYGKDSQEVKNLDSYIQSDKFLPQELTSDKRTNSQIRARDSFLGNWTSTRPNFQIEVLPKEELERVNKEGVNTAWQLQQKFPQLFNKYVKDKNLESDFWLGQIPSVKAPENVTVTDNRYFPQEKTQNTPTEITENVMPWLPQALRLAPSALDPIAKSQIDLQRQESLKMSPESMLAEQERQRQTEMARLENSGLTPSQMASMSASGLASSQMSSNDAIARVEQANQANQYQTDAFNIGQSTKEDITNEQFRQDYQNKVMQSMANEERDWKNYYTQNNLDNANNFKYIEEMNWLNAKNDQFQNVPGQGITYLGNKGVTQDNTAINKLIDNMTPKERFEYTKEVNNGVDKWKAFKTAKEKALS